MSRARQNDQAHQTAAADEATEAGGCFSSFLLPPLAVLLVSALLAIFAFSSSSQALPQISSPAAAAALSPVFTPEIQYWSADINHWAASENIDPNLAAAVMQIESCGNPAARSSAGAVGLFQVMPFHFLPQDDPTDPDTNAARGLSYLKGSLRAANNDIRLALAGYNGGISVIPLGQWFWPAETSRYVYWGSGIYEDALTGTDRSARLVEWLNAGGASLCNQAKQVLGLTE